MSKYTNFFQILTCKSFIPTSVTLLAPALMKVYEAKDELIAAIVHEPKKKYLHHRFDY
jgi:hypothetical protein